MHKRRVVITGLGAVSPFGWKLKDLLDGLEAGRSSLSLMSPDEAIAGMKARVGGKAPAFDEKSIPREFRRTMSRMGIMAYVAAREALDSAGIDSLPPLAGQYRHMGTSISSTTVSPNTLEDFFRLYLHGDSKSVETVRSTVFFKVMGHAVPSNLAVLFGLSGRCLSPAAACASSLQAMGLAYESVAFGRADMMLCGGVEEFHPLLPATFDRIGAASHSAEPATASRPFDIRRDGIVCSEGAGIAVLEEYESARARGAEIVAEIVGFGTNTSPSSIVFPDSGAIEQCMRMALEDSGLGASDISLVNAHATATEHGDIAETQAVSRIFGDKMAVNSLKGYLGHAMAASGSIELAGVICAARNGMVHGTRNLEEADPRCGKVDIFSEHRERTVRYIMKNSFGLGGVNASLLLKL